ncbi:hypothetical protein QQP08_014570 [Theobroma cacao]|nr:hypothetical protein QQP08_014570 [Theobroma cacao]
MAPVFVSHTRSKPFKATDQQFRRPQDLSKCCACHEYRFHSFCCHSSCHGQAVFCS